jgi:hypothetical protein
MKFDELHSLFNEDFQDISKGKKGKWMKINPNVISKDKDLSKELWDLYNLTYAKIGGHVDFPNPNALPDDHTHWSAVDIDGDPEPDVVFTGKIKAGNLKSTGLATDGSKEAKAYMMKQKVKDLNTKGHIAEVSDALAHVLITRHNVPYVDNPEKVLSILGNKKIEWVGEHPSGKYPNHKGWYNRILGDGKKHMKIMVGTPK